MDTSTLPLVIAPRLRAPRGGIVLDGRHRRGGTWLPASARPVLEALARVATSAAQREPVLIGICGFSYRLEPISIASAIGTDAWSLQDIDRNRLHHVHRSTTGEVQCTCGDYVFRRANTGSTCKHGTRLVELGLIPSAVPEVLPPFARRGASTPATVPPAPVRRRRYEPTPEECSEAAQLFAGG